MLEQFRSSQGQFVNYIEHVFYDTKKLSHAYLIETNSFSKSKELVFAFVKLLLCTNAFNKDHTDECSTCHQIEHNLYPDFVLIEPTGSWIKKEQLLSLQEKFKTKSVLGSKRVYVILGAEKLNTSSANTLLKFLEEPEEDIIAILVTTNRYKIINTILSRCQVLSLEHNAETKDELLDDKCREEILNFLQYIKQYGSRTIAYLNRIWYPFFTEKEQYKKALSYMKKIYVDILENEDKHLFLAEKYGQAVAVLVENISINDIIQKLNVIEQAEKKLNYNVNLKLWLDQFIIDFSKGGEENA